MQVAFKNISQVSIDAFHTEMARSEDDAFALALSIFQGDIHVQMEGSNFTLTDATFLAFSTILFSKCFALNFGDTRSGIIELDVRDRISVLEISLRNTGVAIALRSSSQRTLKIDGVDLPRGTLHTFEMNLWEFNQLCALMKRESIAFLVEAFDGIDGASEYFNALNFSEGFRDEWVLR